MYTVEFECDTGHCYEGWYDSAAAYYKLQAESEFTCPVCDTPYVARKYSPHPHRVKTKTAPFQALMTSHGIKSRIVPKETEKALKSLLMKIRKDYEKKQSGSSIAAKETQHINEVLGDKD